MSLPFIFRLSARNLNRPLRHGIRTFTTAPITAIQLPPRPTIKESDIEESFLKGSGPGGQKIVRLPAPSFLLPSCLRPLLFPYLAPLFFPLGGNNPQD